MRDTVKSASYAARATDESVTYLRIYADAEGETHMEEVELALLPRAFFKGHPPLRLTLEARDLAHRRGGIRDERWRCSSARRRQHRAGRRQDRQGTHFAAST
jgi:hypothetical protein